MNRAIEARIAKLEAKAPEPQSPSQFDGMTCDELTVFILEQYAELLAYATTRRKKSAPMQSAKGRASLGKSLRPLISHLDVGQPYPA